MKQLFAAPHRLGLGLALIGLGLSTFAMTREPPAPQARYFGDEFAMAQRALAGQPEVEAAPTF